MAVLTTYPTVEFESFAETQVEGALGAKKKYVIVKANENQGGLWTYHFFDGEVLRDIETTVPGNFDGAGFAKLDRALNAFEGNLQVKNIPGSGSDLAVDADGVLKRTDNLIWQGPNGTYRVGVDGSGNFTSTLLTTEQGLWASSGGVAYRLSVTDEGEIKVEAVPGAAGEVNRYWKSADDTVFLLTISDAGEIIIEETTLPDGETATIGHLWQSPSGLVYNIDVNNDGEIEITRTTEILGVGRAKVGSTLKIG
jgi:hypothetical protein